MKGEALLDDYDRKRSAKKSPINMGAQSYCSLANSAMPKANTGGIRPFSPAVTCLLRFNHLRASTSLARQVPLLMAGTNSTIVEYPILKLEEVRSSYV